MELNTYFYRAVIYLLVGYFLNALIYWNVFKKSGEEGYKAFIPFYNLFILFRIIDLSKIWFWLSICSGIIFEVFSLFNLLNLDNKIITVFYLLLVILNVIIWIMETDQLGNSFEKGKRFKIGYFFLPIVFGLILAFDKSRYIGPNGVKLSKSKRKKLSK